MKQIRWGILISIVALHFSMKAPVWYLISRISEITGGTGWHRSELINQAVLHFNDWWLLGTSDTYDWMPYRLAITSDQSADITNQYISEGINGGILTLGLFIFILVICFQYIGRTLKTHLDDAFYERFSIWCIGVSLFAHLVSFISITYFDQMMIYWYLLLSIIAIANITPSRETITISR